MTQCPTCDAQVPILPGTIQGELIECRECGSELEVISINPIVLEEAPEAGEDWGQ